MSNAAGSKRERKRLWWMSEKGWGEIGMYDGGFQERGNGPSTDDCAKMHHRTIA